MEMNNCCKAKMKERIGINEDIEVLVYGEVSKKYNNMIKVISKETYGGKFCMVTLIKDRLYVLVIDKEDHLGRMLVLDSKNIEKIKFKSYLLGLGRKMYLESKDGSTLELKFVKKVCGLKGQKESLEYIEKELVKVNEKNIIK